MGLPYRGPTETAQFKIDSFGYILSFLCKCSSRQTATYNFNFGVTPSSHKRVVGENSVLFCSGRANWFFAELQIASLMKACHCQAGLGEWMLSIFFSFFAKKIGKSLCFVKSYLELVHKVADMETIFCIALDGKCFLIKLPRCCTRGRNFLADHKDTWWWRWSIGQPELLPFGISGW